MYSAGVYWIREHSYIFSSKSYAWSLKTLWLFFFIKPQPSGKSNWQEACGESWSTFIATSDVASKDSEIMFALRGKIQRPHWMMDWRVLPRKQYQCWKEELSGNQSWQSVQNFQQGSLWLWLGDTMFFLSFLLPFRNCFKFVSIHHCFLGLGRSRNNM